MSVHLTFFLFGYNLIFLDTSSFSLHLILSIPTYSMVKQYILFNMVLWIRLYIIVYVPLLIYVSNLIK